jgi:ribonuclease D
MELITTNEALSELCAELANQRYITVDTEFLREKTFWPQLCLIQTAGQDIEAMIDPLAEGIDLAPFYALLANENVLKVMHGCRQDIEIFFHQAQTIPKPLFDTQIAAMVCGFGDAVGYETLIRKTTGGKIDKGSRFTDWSQRPLSDNQLTYALADVTHLRGAFEFLENELVENGRGAWLDEETALLSDPEIYAQRPENAWKRLRMQDRRPHIIGVLIEVAAWRETEAQSRNVPRNRILKDDALRELALQGPKDKRGLTRLRAVPKGFEGSRYADPLLEAVARGRKMEKDDLPDLPSPAVNRPGIGPLVDLLKVLLKQRSEETGVAPKLIANVSDLERIASDDAPHVAALKGWRHEIFGQYAEALKAGKLALASQDDAVILVERD